MGVRVSVCIGVCMRVCECLRGGVSMRVLDSCSCACFCCLRMCVLACWWAFVLIAGCVHRMCC